MRWRPLLALGLPLVIAAGAFAQVRFDAHRARAGLAPAEALGWRVGGRPVAVRVERSAHHDLERFEIEIRTEEAPARLVEFEIDHDLYGGGFVGGLDLDGDGEQSLVLATRRGRQSSRVVEVGPAGIVERSFDALPDAHWEAVRTRLDRVAPGPGALLAVTVAFGWLLLAVAAYALGALVRLARRAWRR